MGNESNGIDETLEWLKADWDVIKGLLPEGWEAAARETGAVSRYRIFGSAEQLLRVLLIHLSDGCSLRETAARAQAGGLVKVSDVALLKRLKKSGGWFRWMAQELSIQLSEGRTEPLYGRRVRLVDASVIREPGATGSMWRLHYMIDLSTLQCEQALVTLPAEGETLTRFEIESGDVIMADRGLAHRRGIRHVLDHGGDVVIRHNTSLIPLKDIEDETRSFDLLSRLRKLKPDEVGDWRACTKDKRGVIPLRICALKKTEEQTSKAQGKIQRKASQNSRTVRPATLETAGYIIILTTLTEPDASAILESYRHRWQIELAFKRLKSLLQLGHLKKTDPEGAKAWLQGKLLVATLIEMLLAVGERFSP